MFHSGYDTMFNGMNLKSQDTIIIVNLKRQALDNMILSILVSPDKTEQCAED
jgi:hypothetical protein